MATARGDTPTPPVPGARPKLANIPAALQVSDTLDSLLPVGAGPRKAGPRQGTSAVASAAGRSGSRANRVVASTSGSRPDYPALAANKSPGQNASGVRRSLDDLATLELNTLPENARYRMVDEIGRGGMGCVFRAVDEQLRREVAIKQIHPDCLDSPEHVARFLREARVTGRLEHPAIVPIYEIGLRQLGSRTTLYYTMKLVRGRTLKAALTDFHSGFPAGEAVNFRSVDGQRLLDAYVTACNGVAFAHSRGVIHRDLKPDNIMLGDFGETLLLDWGLAKVMSQDVDIGNEGGSAVWDGEGDTNIHRGGRPEFDELDTDPTKYGRTEFGAVMGTPQYLAPEQAAGRRDLLDKQTDVYSLGVVLYQILTGRLPFGDAKPEDVLRLVQERNPLPPVTLRRGVPAELNAICLKALSRDRAKRYQTVSDLALEVRRWVADQPVQAYPEGWWRTLRRWVHSHRTLVACAAVAAGLNLARLGFVWGDQSLRDWRFRNEARKTVTITATPPADMSQWEDQPWAAMRRAMLRLRVAGEDIQQLDLASRELESAALREPENPLPYMALAATYHRLGQTEKAKQALSDANERLQLARARGLLMPETLKSEAAFQTLPDAGVFAEFLNRWGRLDQP